jgi:methionyl aminopeptidase
MVKDQKPDNVAKPRNGTFPDDDLGGNDDEGDDDDDEGDDDDDDQSKNPSGIEAATGDAGTLPHLRDEPGVDSDHLIPDKKKKRKRSKKKKKATSSGLKQSDPPRVLVSSLFPSGEYPQGEMQPYNENLARTTGEEIRANDRMDSTFLSDYRQAAEVHRQVRQWAHTAIKPGKTLLEIAEGVEDGVRALTGHQGLETGDSLKAGMGFPAGFCLNNVAAHWTPNPGQKDVVLKHDDVLKVDFGVHVNGRIVDSAFTVAFDPVYDNLLESVREATNTGIKVCFLIS